MTKTSNPTWVFNDGGRSAAGYKGQLKDCVVRAIAIATESPYQKIYDLVNEVSCEQNTRNKPKCSSVHDGVPKFVIDRMMKQLDWQWVPTMKIGTGCQVHLHRDELPPGRLVVRVTRHVVAVVDGVIHDDHDSTRGGTRCVYGYYQKATPTRWKARSPVDHSGSRFTKTSCGEE
jgi:hypothetical protein